MPRVCRVAPDLTAVERSFDYAVPDDLAPRVRVGAIVRIPLHGRRVRGWVVADDVASDAPTERLLELIGVSSGGPPPEVVALCDWIAHRYAGSRVAVLRSASPPNHVGADPVAAAPPRVGAQVPAALSDIEASADALAQTAGAMPFGVMRWPPLADRRRLAERLLPPRGSAIVCVADASRARALAGFLRGRGHPVVVLHSGDSDAVRTAGWQRAAAGECIVVGGRVAALAPVPDLACAIVFDDADEALQEERVPTWHAREVLVERAARCGARCMIVSAAPSLAAEALAGFAPLAPPRDVEAAGWPRVLVVDRREERPGAGLLTSTLTDALRSALDAGGPAVCVLNRRGRARLLACDACRALSRWDHRGAPIWLDVAHEQRDEQARPSLCSQCGSTRLRVLRSGVTRVREELAALFPRSEVCDVDASTGEAAAADIYVGTEAVLHRAEVRRRRPQLVAFLDLDQELLAPRYRAAEQARWLVVRGAQLLAGRPRHEQRLVLQTRWPEHEVVQAAVRGDPEIVTDAEAARRRALGFPPFRALAELSGDAKAVEATADALRALDRQAAGVTVLGPSRGVSAGGEAAVARALVCAPDGASLADALAFALPAGRALGSLRCAVDPPRV